MEYYRNGIIYYVKKIENENYSQFKERINLIFSQNINSPDDFEQVEKYSRLWFNKKILKCTYSNTIEESIKEFELNHNVL